MSEGHLIPILGVVVSVMLVQALLALAGAVQDTWTKLIAGAIIYKWSVEQQQRAPHVVGMNPQDDNTVPTGAFTDVMGSDGKHHKRAVHPYDAEAAEEAEEEERVFGMPRKDWEFLINH